MSEYREDDDVKALPPVGRHREITDIEARLSTHRLVVVCGEWGSGKTVLLEEIARRAVRGGRVVVRLSGRRGATDECLLTAVRELRVTPEVRRAHPPPLVAVDDAHLLGRAARDDLVALAREAPALAALVLSLPADAVVPEFEQGAPMVELGPLDRPAAHLLLDQQPRPPLGRSRLRVLDEAAGNPLALVELSRSADDVRHLLPVSRRWEHVLTSGLAGLSASTRTALLLAAADPLAGHLDHLDPATWSPAERAGLVRLSGHQVHFRHPLVRSAVYYSVPLEQRRQAHVTLATGLSAYPDRQAWHAAEGAGGPDEDVAARLSSAAARVRRDDGYAAAAATWERAAELSPAGGMEVSRLLEASCDTIWLRQPQWTHELLRKMDTSGDDMVSQARRALVAGRALALKHRYAAAMSVLSEAVEQVTVLNPVLALDLLGTAAVAAYHSGSGSAREGVRRSLDRVTGMLDDGGAQLRRAWIRALIDPAADGAALIRDLPRLAAYAAGDAQRLIAAGTVAWLVDDTPRALELFEDGLSRWQAHAPIPHSLVCAAWSTYFELGRWDTAHAMAERASAETATADLPEAAASALVMRASVQALRGHTSSAVDLATTARTLLDPTAQVMLDVRARWALGVAAVADGDHDAAFDRFRSVFAADGDPVHFHASHTVLADLAAAAARVGRSGEVVPLVDAASRALGPGISARLAALLHRARALSSTEPDDAEHHFAEALRLDGPARWQFEHAQVQLDFGEWLRRRRRIVEARPLLFAALDAFRRLQAQPWTHRAETELRAAGVDTHDPVPEQLSKLTTQQQQIVRLASRGMTNREIGEQLYLSPRTVGSHLYRSFPKLGVTSRAQLRDLLLAPRS